METTVSRAKSRAIPRGQGSTDGRRRRDLEVHAAVVVDFERGGKVEVGERDSAGTPSSKSKRVSPKMA